MSTPHLRQKVVKLLRLAVDRDGTPEGDTARRLAASIMDTHGFTVDEGEVDFESVAEVAQVLLAEHKERQWWQEMLLVSLCDVYGGEAVPIVGRSGWRLYIVIEPDDDVDVKTLKHHLERLSGYVLDLCRSNSIEFMRTLPRDRDRAVASFKIGTVFRFSQLLYRDHGHTEPDLEHMPFMLRALGGTLATPSDAPQAPSAPAATMDLAVPTPTYVPAPPPGEAPQEDAQPDVVEVVPDWHWFDRGYHHALRLFPER